MAKFLVRDKCFIDGMYVEGSVVDIGESQRKNIIEKRMTHHFQALDPKDAFEKPKGVEPGDYEAKTLPELRAIALEKGIDIEDKKKADLIAALTAKA